MPLVAVRLPPGPAFVEALRRAWGEGHALAPLDPAAPAPVIRETLRELRPHHLIDPSGTQKLEDPLEVDGDIGLVVATSGSGGRPKYAELTHAGLGASCGATASRLGISDEDRWLACLPLHHIAGLMVVVRSVLAGPDPALHERFDPVAIDAEPGVTLTSVVPTMLSRMLAAGTRLDRFHAILCGGGPVPEALIRRAKQAGAHLVTSYGATETCGGVVYDGVALEGTKVRISGEGEVLVAGPTLMRRYRDRAEMTSQALRDGWYHTGDAGRIGAGRRLEVLGRMDEMIITGGEKVWPAEVESLLREHPQIQDAAVAGLPDEEWGQQVCALIVTELGVEIGAGGLRAFLKDRASSYKLPRRVEVVDAIPRNAAGKPDRERVAKMLMERS